MKVVYNSRYGGYYLPNEVKERYAQLRGVDASSVDFFGGGIARHDPMLVQAVEEYILENRHYALSIADIGNSKRYWIEEYDGLETVHTDDSDEPWVYVGEEEREPFRASWMRFPEHIPQRGRYLISVPGVRLDFIPNPDLRETFAKPIVKIAYFIEGINKFMDIRSGKKYDKVLAWMPIPKPYDEEGNKCQSN